jgi:hypothetical protein
VVVTETATGSDVITAQVGFKGTITENAVSADTLRAAAAFVASINELATGTDGLTARPFWDVIDDTQTANWVAVVTT